jgi:hypothetical protein
MSGPSTENAWLQGLLGSVPRDSAQSMLCLDLLHPEKEGKKAARKHPDTTKIKFRP